MIAPEIIHGEALLRGALSCILTPTHPQTVTSDSELMHLVQTIVEFFSEEGFDGVVLEIWRQFGGRVGSHSNYDLYI